MVQLLEGIHDCVLLIEISMLVLYASLVSVVFLCIQLKNDAGCTLLGWLKLLQSSWRAPISQ